MASRTFNSPTAIAAFSASLIIVSGCAAASPLAGEFAGEPFQDTSALPALAPIMPCVALSGLAVPARP